MTPVTAAPVATPVTAAPVVGPVTSAPVVAPVTSAPVVTPVTPVPVPVPTGGGKCIPACVSASGQTGVCGRTDAVCTACVFEEACSAMCERCVNKAQEFGGLDCNCSGGPVPTPITAAPVTTPVTGAPVTTPVTAAPVATPVTAAPLATPITAAPVAGPAPSPGVPGGPCFNWCINNPQPWSAKCEWGDCTGCPACFPPTPPPLPTTPPPTAAPITSAPTSAPVPTPPTTPGPTPNILLIMADDVGTGDVPGYWGNGMRVSDLVDLPNLYDLVNKGTVFTDAHATPVCATSRYTLLSGNYPHRGRNSGGTWLLGDPSQFLPGQQTIAQALKDGAGYHTALMGKWHVGGLIPAADGETATTAALLTTPRNNWTKPLPEGPQTFGFDYSMVTDKGIQSNPYAFFRDGYLTPGSVKYWTEGVYDAEFGQSSILVAGQGHQDWDSSAYNMILVNETKDFLDEHFATRPDDPFFAYVALGVAHIPHTAPYNYIDGQPVQGTHPTAFLDMLKEMDLVVGSLVNLIEERGIAEDTIIIFTSDNGGLANFETLTDGHTSQGPLNSFKGTIAEGGHRVPFIMRQDGVIPAGEERSNIVGINDLFATLCELAGVDVPAGSGIDSVSFADYLISNDDTGTRDFLAVFKDTKQSVPQSWTMRYNNFKLNHYLGNGAYTLHNLADDIGEKINLTWNSMYAAMMQEMIDQIELLRPGLG